MTAYPIDTIELEAPVSEKTSYEARARARLAEALEECGVSTEKLPKIVAALMKNIGFFAEMSMGSDFFNFKAKVESAAAVIGISEEQFVAAAEKEPSLFVRSPETMNDNITRSAQLLGMSRERAVQATKQQPQLFYLAPESVARHGQLMKRFGQKGIVNPETDFEDLFVRQPGLLCLADDNFHLRYIFGKVTGMRNAPERQAFNISRKDRESALVEMYGHDPSEKIITKPAPVGRDITQEEQKHRALVAMVKSGIIKSYKYQPE